MPVLIGWFEESSGQPIVDVYVSVNTAEAKERQEAGARVAPPLHLRAMIDTGAGQSVIALDKLELLGLYPVDVEPAMVNTVTTGGHPQEMAIYAINVALAGDQPGPIAEELRVIGSPQIDGLKTAMILGRDILDRCLLVYDGPNRRFTLAYDRPDVADP